MGTRLFSNDPDNPLRKLLRGQMLQVGPEIGGGEEAFEHSSDTVGELITGTTSHEVGRYPADRRQEEVVRERIRVG